MLLSFFGIVVTTSISAQEIRFTKRDTRVNDTSHQTVQCHLVAERTIKLENQLVDSSKQMLLRSQDRRITILQVDRGVPRKARLSYGTSTTRVTAEDNQDVEITQPIAGNTYLVERHRDSLVITDEAGNRITPEEDKLLQQHLQTFGQPNPLAQFLSGKTINIGQAVAVPDSVARELLGLTGNAGKTDSLALRLVSTKRVHGVRCAVFETLLRTHAEENSMALLMKGELVVESETCRTQSIHLQGPVALSEVRGPAEGRFVVSTSGTLNVTVETAFDLSDDSVRTARHPGRRR